MNNGNIVINSHSGKQEIANYEQILIEFNKSILKGDYLPDLSNPNKPQESTVLEKLDNEILEFEANKRSLTEAEADVLDKTKKLIKEYRRYIKTSTLNWEITFGSISSNFKHSLDSIYLNKPIEVITNFLEDNINAKKETFLEGLFYLNLFLAEVEEVLECNDSLAFKLEKLKDSLPKLNDTFSGETLHIYQIIFDKVKFLLAKINFREAIRDKKHLKGKKQEKFDIPIFNELWNKVESHYDTTDKFKIHSLLNSEDVKKVHYYHHYCKYLKRNTDKSIEVRINEVKDLNLKFSNECPLSKGLDQYSFWTMKNLFVTSELKLIFEKEINEGFEKLTKQFIKSSNGEIQILEKFEKMLEVKNSPIPDFNGHFKLLEFTESFISHLRENTKEWLKSKYKDIQREDRVQNDSKLKSIVSKEKNKLSWLSEFYKRILEKTRFHLLFQKKHKLLPVYLDKESCYFKHESLKFYLDSSYILPSYYSAFERELYGKESYIKSAIRSLNNRVELQLQFIVFEQTKSDFDNRVKENEFKVIQIVALFVSVAVFALGSIKIFEGKTFFQNLSILFALGGALTLFNAFFRWLVIGQLSRNLSYPSEEEFLRNVKTFLFLDKIEKLKKVDGLVLGLSTVLVLVVFIIFISFLSSNIQLLIVGRDNSFWYLTLNATLYFLLALIGIVAFLRLPQAMYVLFVKVMQPKNIYSFFMFTTIVTFLCLSYYFANKN